MVKTAPAPDGLCRFAYVKYDAAAPSLTNRYKILSSKKFDRIFVSFCNVSDCPQSGFNCNVASIFKHLLYRIAFDAYYFKEA